jgi:hypothetical protein
MTPQPDWTEHAGSLVIVLILFAGALVAVIGWFVRNEFRDFKEELKKICASLEKKADKTITDDIWRRANNHGHDIECDNSKCKPKTTGVILYKDA